MPSSLAMNAAHYFRSLIDVTIVADVAKYSAIIAVITGLF
jgi:hypothetical protein